MKTFFQKIVEKIPFVSLVVSERDTLLIEKVTLLSERDNLTSERDRLAAERDQITLEKDNLILDRATLRLEMDTLATETDRLKTQSDPYNKFVPHGHFFSPIPSQEDIIKNEKRIWNQQKPNFPGIDLCIDEQFRLLDDFEGFYQELPFADEKTDALRYHYLNPAYGHADAIFLYCMIRHLRPRNIIEIGSGYSSCVSLDTNELFFHNSINIEFIEPYPGLLKSLLKQSDHDVIRIHESNLQDIPIETFKKLLANDILFIDSTHVSKIDSDVNYLIHEILPVLATGVHVHIHDVFYSFEYPKVWLDEGRFWNEQYILRAFLQHNSQYKIVLFISYLQHYFEEKMVTRFPLTYQNTGISIWIKKI